MPNVPPVVKLSDRIETVPTDPAAMVAAALTAPADGAPMIATVPPVSIAASDTPPDGAATVPVTLMFSALFNAKEPLPTEKAARVATLLVVVPVPLPIRFAEAPADPVSVTASSVPFCRIEPAAAVA